MPHEPSNKQSLCLNPVELSHIYGLPHQAQLLYIAIRRQMNYTNGLVGDQYSVSWLELSQALWVEPHSGRKNTGRPETSALRKTAQLLVKVGLISFQSDKQAKRLIIKCELATTDASNGNGNGNGKKDQEIEALKAQLSQLQAENQRLTAKLNNKPVSEPPSKKAQVPTETDHQIAEQLFAIKQSARPSTRTPDLKVWAKSVMTIRERVSIPNENGQGSHHISQDEIVLAFQYAHQINPFWTEQGIITSPTTLLEHLTRKKKTTFRESFIDWLGTRGTKHETHRPSHKTSPTKLSAQESTRNAVRDAFAEIGVELETDPQ
jgi:hypothetical protein